jgi:uncharacterized SAM-binding protein YcdF (DUF218 family)
MTTSRTWLLRLTLVLALLVAGLYLFREKILFSLGQALTTQDKPVKVDAIVTIGGDYSGGRILAAAELVRQGYAPIVIISGAGEQYGLHETDLALAFAQRNGYPADSLVPLRYSAHSTAEEASKDIAELRRRGARSYILVTSISHTARATRMFRREAPDLEIHTVAAYDKNWHNGRWWQDREGRKTFAFEAIKTAAEFLGL